MWCLAWGHSCRLDVLTSSPLRLPPCGSNLSVGLNPERKTSFNPPNNWIIVMRIKCRVELNRLQMFFKPTAANSSSLQWRFAWQTWANMAAEVGWLSLAAEGFWRERAQVGQSKSCFVSNQNSWFCDSQLSFLDQVQIKDVLSLDGFVETRLGAASAVHIHVSIPLVLKVKM